MSTNVSATVSPIGSEPAPKSYLSGPGFTIPVVTFTNGHHHSLSVNLGNHSNPTGYLREWAESLLDLADLIEREASDAQVSA